MALFRAAFGIFRFRNRNALFCVEGPHEIECRPVCKNFDVDQVSDLQAGMDNQGMMMCMHVGADAYQVAMRIHHSILNICIRFVVRPGAQGFPPYQRISITSPWRSIILPSPSLQRNFR